MEVERNISHCVTIQGSKNKYIKMPFDQTNQSLRRVEYVRRPD